MDLHHVLTDYREIIVDRWSRTLHDQSERYRARPLEELVSTTSAAADANYNALVLDDFSKLHEFIEKIAKLRLGIGFALSDVQGAFELYRVIVVPLLLEHLKGDELPRSLDKLNRCLAYTITRFSDYFQSLHEKAVKDYAQNLEREVAARTGELGESEAKYRTLVETSFICVYILQDGLFRFVNKRFCEVYGYSYEDLVGRMSLLDVTVPEDKEIVAQNMRERPGSEVENVHYTSRAVRKGGQVIVTEVFGSAMIYNGRPAILGTSIDITERKRSEELLHRLNRELQAVSNCNQVLMRVTDEQELLNEICRIICDEAGYRMAWVGRREEDDSKTVRPVAWAGFEDQYLKNIQITWADTELGRGPTGTAIRTGESVCIQDYVTDARTVPWREEALQRGYRSSIALPLKDESGRTFAALAIYAAGASAFTPAKVRLMEELAGDLAFGLNVLRARLERNRAESAILESEILYRSLIDTTNTGYVVLDQAGRVLDANQEYVKLSGHDSLGDIQGRGVSEWTADDEKEKNEKAVQQCARDGRIRNFEVGYVGRHGGITPVEVNATMIERNGMPQILALCRDITDRKRAEEEIRMTHQRLFDIIEFLPDATFVIDDEKKVVAWNRACEEMTGVRKEEIMGKGDYAMPFYGQRRPMLADYVTAYSDEMENLYTSVRRSGQLLHAEAFVPMLRKGKGAYISGRASPLYDRTGKVVGTIESLRDITELRDLETQLRHSQKMEAIGTLAGGIAHDFNNILTALVGYANLLKMSTEDATLSSYADEILAASAKATDLVRNLLAFSRQRSVSLKPESLHSIIQGTERLLKRLVTEDVTIRTVLCPQDITVIADATQIDQILFNLATNARDAMPRGGVLAIETSLVELSDQFHNLPAGGKPGTYALLSVSDTGMGMDAATRERVFDPFFTTKEAGKGTGLGLATVYGIVQQHNGHITVHSEPGAGTIFRVYLPLADKIEKGPPRHSSRAKGAARPSSLRKMTRSFEP